MHLLSTGVSAGGSMQGHLQQGHGEVSVINYLPQPEAGRTRGAAEESDRCTMVSCIVTSQEAGCVGTCSRAM